jgi:hypothetical protein
MNQMGLSLYHLLWYADERDDMLNRIATGNESWMHHYNPNQSVLQCNGNIQVDLQPKKFKFTPLARKVMLTMFWDTKGELLAYFKNHGENVNFASYCEVLLKLWDAIRRKHPGQLARKITAS